MYFNIERTNVNLGKKIMLIADIHYYHKYNIRILDGLIMYAKQEKPDYICIAGDVFDNYNESINIKSKILDNCIEDLSHIAPVLIILGNHDTRVKKVEHDVIPTEFLNRISLLKNVYLLGSNSLTKNNITFYGYNAKYNYYKSREKKIQLLEDDFHIETKKGYNILVAHSPINLTKSDVYDNLKLDRFNLILCGHMHNGLMPHNISGNMGLVSPSRKPFPPLARGTLKYKNTYFVVTGGVVKFSHAAHIFQVFNSLYPVSITIIQ